MPPNEKVLKAVDGLYEAVAEEQARQAGGDRIEKFYQRAIELVTSHPIQRVVGATKPAQQEVENGRL